MGQPVNRPPHLRILIDFTEVWKIIAGHMLLKEQKQNLIYHIFSCLEMDPNATLNTVLNGTANIENIVDVIDQQTLVALTIAIHQLMVYHNLFVIEIPDDSNGLVKDFPYGALHVDERDLVLIGDGLSQFSTPQLMATPSLFETMSKIV